MINKNTKQCPLCDTPFKIVEGNKKFCSPECAKKSRYAKASLYSQKRRIKNVKPRPCKICGKEFTPKNGNDRICSDACETVRDRYATHRNCNICNNEFRKTYKYRLFCSDECREESKKLNVRKCNICGKSFKPSFSIEVMCSDHCRNENSKIYNRNIGREKRRLKHHIRKTDATYRIAKSMRANISHSLKARNHKKKSKTSEYLGCSIKELKDYLEKQFTAGMNYDNYGDWHIDHIKPINSFALDDEEELKKCFNYKNLQPLWATDNLSKGYKDASL